MNQNKAASTSKRIQQPFYVLLIFCAILALQATWRSTVRSTKKGLDLDEQAAVLVPNPSVEDGAVEPLSNWEEQKAKLKEETTETPIKKDEPVYVPPLKFADLNMLPWKENLMYSSMYCANGVTRERIHNSARQCIIRNLGRRDDGVFVYHARPGEEEDLMLPFSFENNIIITNESILPSTYETRWVNRPFTMAFPQCRLSMQPGHDFDDIWTVFNGLSTVGLLGLDHILLIQECEGTTKFWSTIANETLYLSALNSTGGILFGTVHIAPGKRYWLSFPTLESGLIAHLYRDRSYAIHKMDIKRNGTVRITVRDKKKRHSIANVNEIVSQLQAKYPSADVTPFKPEKLSARQEIETIASLDIYITPSGGGSFSSQYMANAATTIYVDACWPGNVKKTPDSIGFDENNGTGPAVHCLSLDSFCWDQMPYFFDRYIGPKDTAHLVYDGQNKDPKKRNIFSTLSYSTKLDMGQLYPMVEEALLKANPFRSITVSPTERWSFDKNLDLFQQLRKMNAGKRFSWHNCQNGDKLQYLHDHRVRYPMDWNQRQCLLMDVELGERGSLVYHLDKHRIHPIRLGTMQQDEFLESKQDFYGVNVRVVNDPLPSESAEREVATDDDELKSCVVMGPLYPHKYIHGCPESLEDVMEAGMMMMFVSMMNAGLVSIRNEIAVVASSLAGEACSWSRYWGLMGERFQQEKGEKTNRRLPCVLLPAKQSITISYYPAGSGLLLKLFRDRAWAKFNIVPALQRTKRLIGWALDDTQEYNTLMSEVQGALDQADVDVVRFNLTAMGEVSLKSELTELASFDVLVTSCTRGSYHSLLLRDGASVVFYDISTETSYSSMCFNVDSASHIFKTYLHKSNKAEVQAGERAMRIVEAVELGVERAKDRDAWAFANPTLV